MELNSSEDEQSLPSDDDSTECDLSEEEEECPRIGDDYQIEIPAVLEISDYLHHDDDYFLAESVPVTTIKQEGKKVEHEEKDVELVPDYSYFAPGWASDSWNEAEKATFLVGLYIFSKNFVHLKRFLESKKMKDILSFYYGEFYRSDEYRLWSASRKMKKKGVIGRKIFTGLRKQKLLSRILPRLSKEPKKITRQIFEAFGEKHIQFEEFIFLIKDIIGISILVEAIAIGKGKTDLTTMIQEPLRTNPVVRAKNEFSSLTPYEIAKYLNSHRLSKARSHEFFLEAVLPRLLARGWNTRGPKGEGYDASTGVDNLVFLVPGVMKFSRRYLTKGIDYFESVSDVLNKVASDPSLLQLDNEADEEDDTSNETKSEDDDVDIEERRCYLQRRATKSITEGMKFTIVDTCLGDGNPYRVRELRGLSFDKYCKVNSGRYSEIIKELVAVDDDSEDIDMDNDLVRSLRPCPDSGSVFPYGKGKDGKTRKVTGFNWRNSLEEDDNTHNVSPVIKRRRLTASKIAEPRNDLTGIAEVAVKRRAIVMGLPSAQGKPRQRRRYCDSFEPLRSLSSTPENVGIQKKCFDLNLTPETENEAEHEDDMDKSLVNDMNPQRRGMRNRPPTSRALEAVACGFLATKTRQQKKRRPGNARKRAWGEPTPEPEPELPELQVNYLEPITQESQKSDDDDDSSSSDSSKRNDDCDFQILPR